MMTDKYPHIELDQLDRAITIIENCINDPDYMNPTEFPYDQEFAARLSKLIALIGQPTKVTVARPVGRPKKTVALPMDEVEKEIDEIRKEISQLKIDAKGLETQDRIQIVKTRAALIEKIIGMKERTNNMKKQAAFVSNVMGIMTDLMEQPAREEMLKQLEKYTDE